MGKDIAVEHCSGVFLQSCHRAGVANYPALQSRLFPTVALADWPNQQRKLSPVTSKERQIKCPTYIPVLGLRGSLSLQHLNQSATTFKPQTVERNNNDRLVTMEGSAWEYWILPFVWMSLNMHNPPKHCHRQSTTPYSNSTSQWQQSLWHNNAFWHTTTTVQGWPMVVIKSSRRWPGLQFPRFQSDQSSADKVWCMMVPQWIRLGCDPFRHGHRTPR